MTELVAPKGPTEATGYRVVVSPSCVYIACWSFIVLLPVGGTEDSDVATIQNVCEAVLGENDVYSVYPVNSDEADKFEPGDPVMTYSLDNHEDFYWVYPPAHFKN